jgi:hypothetical protein
MLTAGLEITVARQAAGEAALLAGWILSRENRRADLHKVKFM